MGKVGYTLLKNDLDSRLSPHFGTAKWLLIYDPGSGEATFVRNRELTGHWVVDTFVRYGCADAIFSSIGDGALAYLEDAKIKGWYGPSGGDPANLAALLAEGRLERAFAPNHSAPRHHSRRQR